MQTIQRKIGFFGVELKRVNGEILAPIPNYEQVARQIFLDIENLPFEGEFNRYLTLENMNSLFMFVDEHSDTICGRLIVTRRSLLPDVESRGNLIPLNIPDDSGLAEITHFVFFPDKKIIGIEFNYYGPRPSSLALYIQRKANEIIHDVTFNPIYNHDIDDLLRRIGEVSLIEIEVQKNGINILKELDENLASAFKAAASASDAETVEILLRRKRYSRKGFPFPWLLEKVKALLNSPDPDVRGNIGKFKVRGTDKLTEEQRTFDLLQDKFVASKKVVRTDDRRRSIDKNSMYNAIKSAFQELHGQLVLAGNSNGEPKG